MHAATAPNPDHRPKDAEELLNKFREIQAQIDPKKRQMSLELDLPPSMMKSVAKRGKVSVGSALEGLKEKTSQLISTKPIKVSKPEDSIGTKKRKVSKRVKRNRIIALLLLVGLVFGGFRLLNIGKISVPSLVGMSQTEASKSLEPLGLDLEIIEEVFSEDIPKGRIIASKPGGGGKISPDEKVGLILSKGQERILIPRLNGLTPDVASAQLSSLGLTVGEISEIFDMKIAAGYVIATEPKETMAVKRKTIVNLIVSKGVEQALSELTEMGFDVDAVYKFSDSVFKGQVISQSPEKMDSISKGSKIDLTISKGPEFVFVPNVLGKNKNDASLDLENLGLRVKIKGSGKVNNISPAIGAKVKQGAVITLTLR